MPIPTIRRRGRPPVKKGRTRVSFETSVAFRRHLDLQCFRRGIGIEQYLRHLAALEQKGGLQ